MLICPTGNAVVILSYNGKHLHELFLPKIIAESKGLYDVVLIDNASTDDTYNYVKTHFPEVLLIQHKINNGFAQGYQHGLEQIDAAFFVLLSSDFEVSDNWFAPIISKLQQDDKIAAAQPKILYLKDKKMFEYAGAAGGYMDKWAYVFCRGRIFDTIEKDEAQYDSTQEVFWVSGGCFFVRADVFKNSGGLDLDFFAHMEEIDLCWRIKNAGYKIIACGDSKVYHVGGSVISYGSPQKLFYNYRNNLLMILKNEKTSKILWLIPLRLVLDGISSLPHLLKGKFSSVFAIMKAHFSFYAYIPTMWARRNKKIIYNKEKDVSGLYKQSIILDYFIRKKKKFTDLDKASFR